MLIYRICRADDAKNLEKLVNMAIAEGWALSGGVSVCARTWDNYRTEIFHVTDFHYAQAMVKEM